MSKQPDRFSRGFRDERSLAGQKYGKPAKAPRKLDVETSEPDFVLTEPDLRLIADIIEAADKAQIALMFSRVYGGKAVRIKTFSDVDPVVVEVWNSEDLNSAGQALIALLREEFDK
jgi:hypothetical protein